MIPLTDPRKNFENTIHCFDSKYPEDQLFCELTMIQISASQFTMTILVLNSLWIIFCFANRLLIHHRFAKFTMNPLLFSRTHYKSTAYFANLLWIHHLFPEFTMDPLFFTHCLWYQCFANSLSINHLFRELTVNSLSFSPSFSRIHYEFTIYFRNSLWI